MSIRDHEQEIVRWFSSPEGTKVWRKLDDDWRLLSDPTWAKDVIYIVDDRHAKMRMEWIDRGKPPIEFYHPSRNEWLPALSNPYWDLVIDYRFKPSEWETPEGEDPITYHAKRLGNKGGDWYLTKKRSFLIGLSEVTQYPWGL